MKSSAKLCSKDQSAIKSKNKCSEPIMTSPEEALALKIHCDLSDNQYQMIRNASIQQNANIFPSLHNILEAKTKCYPNDLKVTETSAECSLQNMVDHTLNSVISLSEDKMKEQFSSLNGDENIKGTFYVKVGFDGSSSQSIYKQRYDDTDIDKSKKN